MSQPRQLTADELKRISEITEEIALLNRIKAALNTEKRQINNRGAMRAERDERLERRINEAFAKGQA